MTPQQFMQIEGALITTSCLLLVVCVIGVWLEHWRDARRWRRFCSVNGGEANALAALVFTEECHDQDTDARIRHAARFNPEIFEDTQ